MKQVAIFGGAFDPIHNGHVCITNTVLNCKFVDEVWYLPCYKHTYNKQLTKEKHRLAMCDLTVDNDKIKVSNIEIQNKFSGKSYDFLTFLPEICPNILFSFIIGQDNANTFSNWYRYEEVIQMVPFIVVPRKGVEPETDWYLKPPHIYLENDSIPKISSTEIRDWFRTGEQELAKEFLYKKVFDYIQHKGLYK